MKTTIYLLSLSILIISCNQKSSDQKSGKENTSSDAIKPGQPDTKKETAPDNKTAELEKLTPLSEEELKKIAPAELMGAAQTDLTVNSNMGAGMVNATYQFPNSSDINLTIFDCAGPGGMGIYTIQYLNLINEDRTNEDGTTKVISFGGGKAITECDKDEKNCTLTWFTGGRYLVVLDGDETGLDKLKQAAQGLRLP